MNIKHNTLLLLTTVCLSLSCAPKTNTSNRVAMPTGTWPPSGYQQISAPAAPGNSTPGWVELPSRISHRAMEAVMPKPPLLQGMFADDKFFTDGVVEGATLVQSCPEDKQIYLDLNTLQASSTLPPTSPETRLLLLCDGVNPIAGKEGILAPKP